MVSMRVKWQVLSTVLSVNFAAVIEHGSSFEKRR